MAISPNFKEYTADAGNSQIQIRESGNGDPLLILHGELGFPGWMNYHQSLSDKYTVYAPSHSGYDSTPALDWIMHIRDMAGWYLEVLDDLNLENINLMGLSFGGWIAAEMAVMNPEKFRKLVLVSATGIKPEIGEIYDIFLNIATDYLEESFHNKDSVGPEYEIILPKDPTPERREAWEVGREQSCRLGWKPYMNDPALKHLLHRLKNLDTLLVWGKEDTIVPIDSARIYNESIPGSKIEVFENCGHRPEIEKSKEFTQKVLQFLS